MLRLPKIKLPIYLLTGLFLNSLAHGVEFTVGDFNGSFNSQISVGSSWRLEEPDLRLLAPGNTAGTGQASSGVADDGNLNFDDGEIYSLIIKGVHDLEISNDHTGVFVRFKYWYDQELEDGTRPHGNLLNSYAGGQSLDDSNFDDFAKASGFEFLDAFVFGNFTIGDSVPVDLRLGRQVLSWGESTFIQNGINIINPVDVSAFRRPGAEIKEGLLPVNLFSASFGLTNALSLDAFYQLEWEKTVIDGCGTYFSDQDVAATGCNGVTLRSDLPDQINIAAGAFITRTPDIEPDDGGQYGISLRYFAEKLNGTEFGVYYINHHSRLPYLGGVATSNPVIDALSGGTACAAFLDFAGRCPFFIPGNPLGGNPQYSVEFPEDIEVFGGTFATNLGGYAISGEVSYRPDYPVQINTTEILAAAVSSAPFSTVLPRVIANIPGGFASGYDDFPVTQAQITVIKFFEQVLGANRLSLAAEVGADFVGSLPDQSIQRYGRSPTFGIGAFEPIPLAALGIPIPGAVLACDNPFISPPGFPVPNIIPNPNTANCTNEGYVTDNSWGYRIRGSLTYNDAIAGINLTPSLAWSHDVDGYSPNTNFMEDRKALSIALEAEYLNRYTANLAYTTFSGGDYNTQKDRDFISLSFDISF